jgi:hypothetical protein
MGHKLMEEIMNSNKNIVWATACMIGLMGSISGCASIASGTKQTVSFNSSPEGATVSLNGDVLGTTPLTASIPKRNNQSVVFSKEGYQPLSKSLDTTTNPWFWGNILIGGLVGSSTDGTTGAMYEYQPSQYLVTLAASQESRLETYTSQSAHLKVRDYIIFNHTQIARDLKQREGEYLNSLLSLLSVNDENKGRTIEQLSQLSAEHPGAPEFAEHVVASLAQ